MNKGEERMVFRTRYPKRYDSQKPDKVCIINKLNKLAFYTVLGHIVEKRTSFFCLWEGIGVERTSPRFFIY